MLELRPEVRAFAGAMERKLRENDRKDHWTNEAHEWLLGRLREETDELAAVIPPDGDGPFVRSAERGRVLGEAADVANFAMMIADVCGALPAGRDDEPSRGAESQPERMFPVLHDGTGGYTGPLLIPWRIVAPHEPQAKRNHGGQSLDRLAERGGLSPSELLAVLENRSWSRVEDKIVDERLREMLAAATTCSRCAELEGAVERACEAIDRDRSGLAAALGAIVKDVDSYSWIEEGRGPYEWDDDRYKDEAGRALRRIAKVASKALEASGRLADVEYRAARAALAKGKVGT